ncbi:AMP-binding protein, partial [Klebsiella pneumoniae]
EVQFYDDLIAGQNADFEWPTLDENSASSLCYTSGTTGNPKGVLFSHRSTVLHSYAIILPDSLNVSAADIMLPVVPMFHVNAWGTPYAAAMVGCTLVLPGPGLDGVSLVNLIDTYQVSVALGVPTIWQGLIAAANQSGSKLESLKRNVV